MKGRLFASLLVLTFAFDGCSGGSSKSMESIVDKSKSTLQVSSSSIQNGAEIDKKYVCKSKGGSDISPQLNWSGAPQGVGSYAIIMDDEVAPCGKGDKACVHWAVFNIPSTVTSLPEGKSIEGVAYGVTYNGKQDYEGPCPPNRHIYNITVYALDAKAPKISSGVKFTRSSFAKKYKDHILSYGTISGSFDPSK